MLSCAGPSDAIIPAGNLTAGQNFDSGNVCANNQRAFVYIKNDCALPSRATIIVRSLHRAPTVLPIEFACMGIYAYLVQELFEQTDMLQASNVFFVILAACGLLPRNVSKLQT
jgi:hypothetical protein